MREEAMGIFADLQALARKEVQLAKAELSETVGFTTRSLAFGGAALLMALLTAVFVFVTVLFVLDTFMPLWAAALVTTLILGALTALAGFMALQQFKRISVVPKRTLESVREDVTWAKSQMSFSEK